MWQQKVLTVPLGEQEYEVGVWVLPRGSILYRGRTEKQRPVLSDVVPLWFSPEPEVADIYGYIDEFVVDKPVVLLDLAHLSSHALARRLYEDWARQSGRHLSAFTHAYPVVHMGRRLMVARDSSFDSDALLVEWWRVSHPVAGVAGWGTAKMPSLWNPETGTALQYHHPEVMIVAPGQYLSYVKTLTQEVSATKELDIAYKQIQKLDAQRRQKGAPQKRARALLGAPRPKKLDFGEDEDDTEEKQ